MGYTTNLIGAQYLRTTPETIFSYPLTMNGWFYATNNATQRNLMMLHNTADGTRFAVALNASNQLFLAAVASSGTTQTTITTPTVSTNTWFMATVVIASATSRTIYLNANNATTGTVSRIPTTPTRILMAGQYTGGATSGNFTGNFGEIAVWDTTLTVADITSLHRGAKASIIRPQNLQIYYPLLRDVVNYTGTHTINDNTGVTGGEHPRRYG